MAHTHTKECEDLRAARDALKAQLESPQTASSTPIGDTQQLNVVSDEAGANVEAELATVEAALRDAGCDYAS